MTLFGRTTLVAICLAAIAAGSAWYYVSRADIATDDTFETRPVTRGVIRKSIATSGPVRALVTVQVGSQLSGQVIELRADFNTEVKQGDVLAIIDPKTFAVRVAQAKADLEAAKAALVHQTAALTKAEAVLRLSEQNSARQQQLSNRGIAARATLDTAEKDLAVAKSDLAVATAQIAVAKATVAQKEASLRQSEIDLERTEIRAPIDGTIISRTIDQGQTVAASLQAPELFKIAQDLGRIRIEAQVNEADVGAIATGNPATFTVDAYPTQTFNGTVTQVRLAATELQNVVTYTIIVEAANEERKLFPGMTANVEIETDRLSNAKRLPAEALRFRPKSVAASSASTRGGPGSRQNSWKRRIESLKKLLSLSDEQVDKLRTGLKALSAEMRGSAGSTGGEDGDRAQRRELFRQRFAKLVKGILTEDQLPMFMKWQKGRASTRSATVWVRGADGAPERRNIQIGIADESYVEIKRGKIDDGEQVIIRQVRKR